MPEYRYQPCLAGSVNKALLYLRSASSFPWPCGEGDLLGPPSSLTRRLYIAWLAQELPIFPFRGGSISPQEKSDGRDLSGAHVRAEFPPFILSHRTSLVGRV